jgi:hypothetical protein
MQRSAFASFDVKQLPIRLTEKKTFISCESKDFDRMPNRKRELWNGRKEKMLINKLLSGECTVLTLKGFNPQWYKTSVHSYLFL